MFSLITESVRCLHTRQCTPIAPLTLLVGENSSGKSTFLALYRATWDMLYGRTVDFNEEPFFLGSFDDIATLRGGTAGRAKEFHLGYELDVVTRDNRKIDKSLPRQMQVIASLVSREGQPTVTSWKIVCGPFELLGRVEGSADDERASVEIRTPTGTAELELDRFGPPTPSTLIRHWDWFNYHLDKAHGKEAQMVGLKITGGMLERRELEQIGILMGVIQHTGSAARPYALAPVRTKPKRTYDPVKYTPQPEGEHVPMILAKSAAGRSRQWRDLRGSLVRFGLQSDLFKAIDVKRLGRKGSDPFQIRVKIDGHARNLLDVGYGVCQVLPILVDSLASQGRTILLQQPEVHLHPRAQAEIGTFLAELVKKRDMRFIVETHSDHLLDRIRLDIRDKRALEHQQVLILYFARDGAVSTIHPLTLDEYGNIQGAPQSYREFFLREEQRHLLG